jgi:hypothetical protein
VASLVMWRLNPNVWRRNLAFVLVPYLVVVMAVFGVKSLNESYYGIFVTNEEQSREMNDAVGAIHRVNPAKPRNRYVVATKETRERIYAVSPSFARLQNVFEGELGRQWAEPICQITKECGENNVGWGWFTWELRQAALLNGHQDNAVEAAQFYDQISKEIDAACLDGRLSCQPLRSSTMPDWELELLPVGLRTLFQTSEFVLSFRGFNVQDLPSEGDRAVLSEYSALSLEQVDPTPPQLSVSGWAISTRSPVEISIRDVNGKPVDSTVEKVPRPDVVDFAKKAGYQLPVTPDSGFQVTTSCSRSCSLFIREAKEDAVWQKALPLDGSVRSYFQGAGVVSQGNATDPDLGALFRGDVILFLDTVSIVDDVGQLQRGLNSLKLAILKQIGRCYQVGMPITFLAASILFVTAWLQSIRYRTIPMSLLVVSLILLLMLNRLAVMVAFDVVAIPTSSQLAEYQRYVYPLLLMFVALLLLAPVGTLLRPRQI